MSVSAPSRPLREGLFRVDPDGLLASRCDACGSLHFPPKRACPDCHGDAVSAHALGTRGTVRSFTVVRNAPTFFPQPYVLAYVELPEGLQVFTQLGGVEPEAVQIGMQVQLSIEPIRKDVDGVTDVIAYRFHPVEEGE
ncbi:MAG: Zn-ribbon domain-containing OB-fold protein [Acidimicrobiales bacterium]|nr:Zn-ribbon domain-containing OB-fold protein [Acidimicrobiales bacterium]